MKHFGSRELMEQVISKNLCIGCGACQDLCPYFRSYRGKTARLFDCTRDEGRCFAYCPKAEVDLDGVSATVFGEPYSAGPLGRFQEVLMVRAGRRVPPAAFQSGGSVSALLQCALDAKAIDAAVLTGRAGLEAVPRIAVTAAEIRSCAASKYTAAPTLAALNRAVREGRDRLGGVTTPCQTLALAQMRSNPLKTEGFYDPVALSIGLFCTWALDFRAFDAFLADRLQGGRIRKIDIPPPPAEVLVVETDEGTRTYPLSDIRSLIPESCSYCPDMTSEFSDLSVGVVEGRPDWNTLIVRTERGMDLFEKACRDGWLLREELPPDNLAHLRWAAGNKKQRALAKGRAAGLVGPPGGEGFACLRLRDAIMDELCADEPAKGQGNSREEG